MENMGGGIQRGEEPKKRKHKSDNQKRTTDEKKAEGWISVWDSGFARNDEFDWGKWNKLVKLANQGRSRRNIAPMSLPPYEPDDSHDWETGEDFPLPHANPQLFLQFAIVIKRFRNWLDGLKEHCLQSDQCCTSRG